ncbi:50S ribosomal protein L25/general stress protein Ctc [Thioalkalicoccus limnaeus]|uniref:Large ribosomal subunit protein bL25 n=1 Tax=Thioalkalicoccus limnaeus TaxID=120681 RepID=A0ABV4BKQ5_9GAMM
MSVSFDVIGQPRSGAGKGASRRLRRTGLVPAIVYGGHRAPEPISVVHNDLIRHLENEAFYSHILTLKIGDTATKVVLKDLQRHPAKPFILHADFQRVSADEQIRMTVPLHFVNEQQSKGVKLGGWVSHLLTEVEIVCLPKDLPEFISIDMSEMDIGDSLLLSALPLPEGVALASAADQDEPVVIIYSGRTGDVSSEEGEEPV